MLVSVSSQAYIFLCTVLGGMAIGFVYDLFRVSRKTMKTKNIIVYLEDILFWIFVSVLTFGMLFASNAGQIRGYAFLGLILGVIIYAFLISYFVVRGMVRGIEIFKKVIIKVYKITIFPIKLIMKILYIPISYICKIHLWIKNVLRKILDWILGRIKLNIKNIKVRFKKI